MGFADGRPLWWQTMSELVNAIAWGLPSEECQIFVSAELRERERERERGKNHKAARQPMGLFVQRETFQNLPFLKSYNIQADAVTSVPVKLSLMSSWKTRSCIMIGGFTQGLFQFHPPWIKLLFALLGEGQFGEVKIKGITDMFTHSPHPPRYHLCCCSGCYHDR